VQTPAGGVAQRGKLTYVVFYNGAHYPEPPIEVLYLWQGGAFAANAKHRHHLVTRTASMPVPEQPHDGGEWPRC